METRHSRARIEEERQQPTQQTVIAADITRGAAVPVSAKRPPFSLTNLPSRFSASYDVSRDGQRIVFATVHGGDAKLVVIVNWFIEVRRKLHQTGR